MMLDSALALAGFALVTSITPGPNNLMLMASGVNFGIRRTLPHMLGVALGFVFMAVLVGLGLMRLFDAWPPVYTVLKVASVAYLLYLAWKIANAAAPREGAARGDPLTFLQAAAFQWVNPKAWAMALSAITVYAPDRSVTGVLAVAFLFGVVNLPSVGLWALAGQGLRRYLADPRWLRLFNWSMAVLLVGSMLPML